MTRLEHDQSDSDSGQGPAARGDGDSKHLLARVRRRGRVALVAAVALALLAPAAATAAARPTVRTTKASNVDQLTARLTGTVNPNDRATTYFFEYGTTTLYGAATPANPVGDGHSTVAAASDIGGLAPATRYHYRLVAQNVRGVARGHDRSFRTDRQPLGLTLAATPNPVAPGGRTTLAGTLAGTGNADRQVMLQANPFPYTQGFVNAADIHLTNAAGGFAFPILAVGINTQYRVLVPTHPDVASPVVTVGVAVRVTAHVRVRRTRHRAIVSFSGTVRPAHDRALVAIQRLRGGNWVTIDGTVARHARRSYSRYSERVSVSRSGTFRVLADITDGDHVSGASRTRHIRVRR